MRRRIPLAVTTLALLAATAGGAVQPGDADPSSHPPTVVYLVRHAEKAAHGPDPELTPQGRERAAALAEILAEAGIGRILSTDTRRTRDTAAPLARALDLPVEIYDAGDLEAVADELSGLAGAIVLVVGHSNTTPALVELLGGEPGPPIDEVGEYDRLYRVELPSGRTTVERFDVVSIPVGR